LKLWKIEEDITNKQVENKERGKNIVRHGGLKLAENIMRGKNIMRKEGSKALRTLFTNR